MVCPNCGKDNKNTNIRCDACNMELMDMDFQSANVITLSKKTSGCLINVIIFFVLVPWFLVGSFFLGIGIYSTISEHEKAKDYMTTNAYLSNFTECSYDDLNETCSAVYEYVVDGITYTTSPSIFSNKDNFDKVEKVYYNPNDPSEAVIFAGWHWLILVGAIVDVVVLGILIGIKLLKKKFSKQYI